MDLFCTDCGNDLTIDELDRGNGLCDSCDEINEAAREADDYNDERKIEDHDRT